MMKAEHFGPMYRAAMTIVVSLTLMFFVFQARAQTTLIDFEAIPPYPATVDSFAHLFPGLTLSSGDQWVADEVDNPVFENIQGRSISSLSAAPLTVSFDSPARDLTMDLGSGQLGVTSTVGIMGFLRGQPVFSNSFVTHLVPGGADEVRAHTFGTVDTVIVMRTAGSSGLTLDNLSFVVPEPTTLLLLSTGGLVLLMRLIALRIRTGK